VVVKALCSPAARERGWRVLRRDEQVDGMRRWHRRGSLGTCRSILDEKDDTVKLSAEEIAEACIRCEKGSEDGTMGFFVAGFVRDAVPESNGYDTEDDARTIESGADIVASGIANDDDSEEEWNGF